jgi:hypothetical protein
MDFSMDDAAPLELKDATTPLWDGPPPPPDPETVIGDLSCQGTIAITLRDALREFQQESMKDSPNFQFDIDRIMQSFGEAVAQCQQDQYTFEVNAQRNDDNNNDVEMAPAALLRGRVNYYNRLESKWRFVVDDVEILPRQPLDKNRRKRERPSLWTLPQRKDEPPVKIQRLEILIYNDIE